MATQTTQNFIRTAHADRLLDLLEEAQNAPVSVPECRLRITRTSILRELAHRGILISAEKK